MTPGDKARLLRRVAQESRGVYPGIDTIAGVCGVRSGVDGHGPRAHAAESRA